MKKQRKREEIKKKSFFLLLTAFIAGFVVMALEIVGFRIFAPYFGFSIFVSGTLIGIVLIALTAGAYCGGILADKKGDYNTIFYWIFYAVIYMFIALISYKYILSYFSSFFLPGVIISSLVLFGFPMVVLSMVSPYLVKLIARKGSVGRAAGNISAVGMLGSILGTFIPTFLLIPYVGSFFTFFLSVTSLLLIVIIYFSRQNKLFLLNGILLFTFLMRPAEAESNVIVAKESVYNLVKVVDVGNSQYQLRLNDDKNMQSLFIRDDPLNDQYYYYYLNTAPLINKAASVLVLGMGAGTSPYQMIKLFGIAVDAVEIDPYVVEVAQEYFGLDQVKDNLNIFVDDGRTFLRKTSKQYDVIEVDMYQGGFYAPFYVFTREFFQEVEARLTPKGVVTVNVLYPVKATHGDLLFKSVGNTMASNFEHVFYLNLGFFNVLLFATNEDVTLGEVRRRIIQNAPDSFQRSFDIAYALKEYQVDPSAPLLTDDKAPLEQLTYKMLAGIPKQ